MKIALLSNVTLDLLARMLAAEHSLWVAPGFGAWMEIALDPPKELLDFKPDAVFLLLDETDAPVDRAKVDIAVAALESSLPLATVIVPDLGDLQAETANFCDVRMISLAATPWSLAGHEAICREIDRLLELMRGGRKKVLALDLDNTLWRGVIGEDGAGDIEPFDDFQRGVKSLGERGVLLVALSKNNESDVEPAWGDPRMVLARGDFVETRVNWRSKSENLEEVAASLNLATDAFVFVDDNPAERAEMAARHPEVAVSDWPVTARRLARLYFPRFRLTAEDLAKSDDYRAEAERRKLASALSFDDYLESLAIRVEIRPVAESEFARVAQLSQKSNQFNACTNRYAIADIARFAADCSHLVAIVRASDRFGDQGLVAFVHAVDLGEGVFEIVDWVMSCRAMNRRIEFRAEAWLEEELKRRGARSIVAHWRRSAKNAPVENLFESFGFDVVGSSADEKRYVREIH